ncbi:MAG TPA: hypothetical protein VHC90_11785 [Bryobacteraceae bacterium]|nr:hypothetical protein [Bryobacteraceae bacterium]
MRLLASLIVFAAAVQAASVLHYSIAGDDPGSWPRIFASVGFTAGAGLPAHVFVVRSGAPASVQELVPEVKRGGFLILEGESDLAASLGFRPTAQRIVVRSMVDRRAPELQIVWEKALELPRFVVPAGARVFATERWTGAPLMASVSLGSGSVLWVAAPPGEQGYERFPYLLQALDDLGLHPPVRSARLWAFFDSAYRSRVDLDYFARRWRAAGISALQVAAWHYWEPDPQRDEYLKRLIDACHRQSILVYAWLEFPHVSEKFWADHPEWREKTAILQDAHLDWRKLMNLRNPEARAEVEKGARRLLTGFDWDGVNLAELYFESLEGASNPARFTPMNDDVRREFQQAHGFDPIGLFRGPRAEPAKLREFLDFRAGLARQLQEHWIGVMENIRASKPDMDLVLTHVDDRFDTRMHNLIGADASQVLPMMGKHNFTFLVEDPATIWNLGPDRYSQIAERYRPLVDPIPGGPQKLAVDINIVERYQDVYPTKQQTGAELFQLVHAAALSFPRVALYFENSILPADLALLPAAASAVTKIEEAGAGLAVRSSQGAGISWKGPAKVDGRLWPVRGSDTLWLPAGSHVVEPAASDPDFRVLAFNGNLGSAKWSDGSIELSYQSDSRAMAVLNRRPTRVEIDGEVVAPPLSASEGECVITLPRGQHLASLW